MTRERKFEQEITKVELVVRAEKGQFGLKLYFKPGNSSSWIKSVVLKGDWPTIEKSLIELFKLQRGSSLKVIIESKKKRSKKRQ